MGKEIREMSFLDHLEELRGRLIKSLISIILFSVVAYVFSDRLLNFLTSPLPPGQQIYFMSPTEAFSTRIKISLVAGLIVSVPVIFYHAWKFVVPGLLAKETKFIIPIVFSSSIFFLIGATFCFLLVLPASIKFLMGFGTEKLKPMIQIKEYISFVSLMTLAFGAVFELPVISYFLGKIGLISAKTLIKGRKYAIVIILIVAAAITPTPDAFTQLLLACPLYVLYEVSIVVLKLTAKKKDTSEIPHEVEE
ncbi:MAG: twin-arginine translocase subunit TatC [Candidatus Zixiibacteriota bacterium]